MAYTLPTAAQLKARHPAFAGVADATVDVFIAEAALSVDTTWLEKDYARAIMYLACHMMVGEGLVDAGNMIGGAAVQSEKLGDASTTYATPQAGSGSDEANYQTTTFGQQFVLIRRANFGGPYVAPIGC